MDQSVGATTMSPLWNMPKINYWTRGDGWVFEFHFLGSVLGGSSLLRHRLKVLIKSGFI